ncbi:MAG: polyphosphate kinase, partial [Bacteroidetes bacterium]
GISAKSFKKPTSLEMDHDFLWRVHQHVPRKGRIQIFNRSHYEDVLIQRVHKWIDEKTVDHRFEAINNFERNLMRDNNTTILKFYLHISESEQKVQLQQRIDDPSKSWKHNDGDWEERKKWKEYMRCYTDVINRSEIPWIIAPVDQRWYRDFFVASRILEAMESLNLQVPKINIKKRSK